MIVHRSLFLTLALTSVAALPLTASTDPGSPSSPARATPPPTRNVGLEATRTWVDIDADGRLDLYVADSEFGDRLFLQVAPGEFEDRFEFSGLASSAGSLSAHWSDYDGDQRPDVFRVGVGGRGGLWRNMGDGTFADVTDLLSLPEGYAVLAGRWLDLDGDALPDLEIVGAQGTRVLHNEGGQSFVPSLLLPVATDVALPAPVVSPAFEIASPGALGALGAPDETPAAAAPAGGGVRPSPDLATSGAPATTSVRTRRRAVLSELHAATAGGGSVAGLQLAPNCAITLKDQSGGGCLRASSSPQLGKLYPLSSTLFVSSGGRVGIGTTNPTFGSLHVKSFFSDPNIRLEGTGADGLGGSIAFGASTFDTYLSEFEDGAIYAVAPTGVGLGPGNVGIHVASLAEATHALTIKPNSTSTDILRLIGPSGTYGYGAKLNFGDGNYTVISEDADDHILVHARLGTTVETDGILAVPALQVNQVVGSGTASPALRVDNSSTAAGIAMFATSAGTDANTVITQNGSGPLLRGFVGGALKFEMRNDGRMVARSVEITGGSDLVESFDSNAEVEPGTVLVIDPENPGQLMPSSAPYDARVAGIASGAGGIEPGLHLRQDGVTDGAIPVAMVGRVYVKCNTENGAVHPGDLLTTSSVAGHAMRASDPERSFGTVIGKAMTGLDGGTGLVLVLVNLQ